MCPVRNVELEVALTHLGARRGRGILHSKLPRDCHLALRRLDTHDVSDHGNAVNFFCDVVDFERDGRSSGRCHAVIGDVLMNGANQVRGVGILEFETELAFGIGLGTTGFFHTLAQLKYDNLISHRGFAGSGVLHGAG